MKKEIVAKVNASLIMLSLLTQTTAASGNETYQLASRSEAVLASVPRTAKSVAFAGRNSNKESRKMPVMEPFLLQGKLSYGESELRKAIESNPKDDNAKFELGLLQFLRSVERLGQDLYNYGLKTVSGSGLRLPFTRLPIGENPNPAEISYEDARNIVQTFVDNLGQTEKTLLSIKDENVKVPLHFGLIRLDLNGDGVCTEKEGLWQLYYSMTGRRSDEKEPKDFVIAFDRGDVHWLAGYCNLISGVCQVYLAYDSKEMFESTAHMFFPRVKSPYRFLDSKKSIKRIANDMELFDIIAFIHLISWEVKENERMALALSHFENVVHQSRISWKFIMAETDDDREWLPNPRQTGVIPGVSVTDDMVKSWAEIMNETEKLLAGKLLIPFWRGDETQGINLRRVFTEPRKLDVVLWVQGTAACPYLEKGKLSRGNTWRRLMDSFGPSFPGFALWFN